MAKRFVRTFRNAVDAGDEQKSVHSNRLQAELDKPLVKEASLNYVLRKAADLQINLRKIFAQFDKNQINVIPRSKFCGMLIEIPLGLNEAEITEIMENDLSFDNYGNVDYTVILNGDLFCLLERQRLKAS